MFEAGLCNGTETWIAGSQNLTVETKSDYNVEVSCMSDVVG
jgi:hypothetical protein